MSENKLYDSLKNQGPEAEQDPFQKLEHELQGEYWKAKERMRQEHPLTKEDRQKIYKAFRPSLRTKK